jgi:hypothetical protein
VSNFDQFFVGLPITVFELDGGRRFATPMDLLWQINYGEMLSGLMVTTFLILLDASVGRCFDGYVPSDRSGLQEEG